MNACKVIGQNFPDIILTVDSGSLGSEEKQDHALVVWDDKATTPEKEEIFQFQFCDLQVL